MHGGRVAPLILTCRWSHTKSRISLHVWDYHHLIRMLPHSLNDCFLKRYRPPELDEPGEYRHACCYVQQFHIWNFSFFFFYGIHFLADHCVYPFHIRGGGMNCTIEPLKWILAAISPVWFGRKWDAYHDVFSEASREWPLLLWRIVRVSILVVLHIEMGFLLKVLESPFPSRLQPICRCQLSDPLFKILPNSVFYLLSFVDIVLCPTVSYFSLNKLFKWLNLIPPSSGF